MPIAQDWMVFETPGPLDLRRTLESGQTFRWSENAGCFEGVVGEELIRVRQEGTTLSAQTSFLPLNRDLVADYFCLASSPAEALHVLSGDEPLRRAVARHPGIRLLRQDPWECLASFILAINKSIGQIKKNVAALCTLLGPKRRLGDRVISLFPTPEIIAATPEAVLRTTRIGFRAKYLKAAAHAVVSGTIDLLGLRKRSYAQAREALCALYGVGPKVADCVCLFSLDHPEAFPVDVWMQRAMQRHYGDGEKLTDRRTQEIARERFGRYAGLAQQYLYHDIRMDGSHV